MLLPGRLGTTTLGDLLGRLHRAGATGVLELLEVPVGPRAVPGRAHAVHFVSGLVGGIDSALAAKRLGELLRDRGALDDEGARRLEERVAAGDPRLAGEILVAEGLVPRGLLTAAIRGQMRAKLDALFRLDDAAVRFHVARPRRRSPTWLTPAEFLHGRARRRDHAPHAGSAPPAEPAVDTRRRAALAALGLTDDAGPDVIRRAFKRLATELHPDRNPQLDPSERARREALFARLTAAYHALM